LPAVALVLYIGLYFIKTLILKAIDTAVGPYPSKGITEMDQRRLAIATAIQHAIERNQIDTLRAAVEAIGGADTVLHHLKDSGTQGTLNGMELGIRPLHYAAHLHNVGCVRELVLKLGATVDLKSGARLTPLQSALTSPGGPGLQECAQILVEAGASLDVQEPSTGNTPLYIAIGRSLDHLAKCLINYGADLRQVNQQGNVAMVRCNYLDFSCYCRLFSLATLLTT
jgi:hypothetical protein